MKASFVKLSTQMIHWNIWYNEIQYKAYIKLDIDKSGKLVGQKIYRSMIGSLKYVTDNKPAIMFIVCPYARFKQIQNNYI